MRFRILGPLEVLSPEGWTAISAAKWRSLLAALLLRHGQLIPTESLIDELWGDSPPSTANNLVSIYIHRLKKLIGDTESRTLVYRAPGYMLRVAPGDLDLENFESLAAEGADALVAADAERAAELLGAALGLWRGTLLADVPRTSLLATFADRAAELWTTTTELRVEADLRCGRAAQVVPELRGLVLEHPLRERLWALLVRALEEAGRRAEALEAYAQARQVISDELGVDPGSELQRLYADLLAADASAATPPRQARLAGKSTPDRVSPLDNRAVSAAGAVPDLSAGAGAPAAAVPETSGLAGEEPSGEISGAIAVSTFADLQGAVPSAHQSLASTAELAGADESAHAPLTVRPAQLPADIADFTGRERHADQLGGLLLASDATGSPGAVRVVVISGTAGLGKTTLAVHAAHRVSSHFPDGQLYVDLLGASAQPVPPGEVLARFLRDLGVEGDKTPARDDERAALYRTTLTGRRVLVLLDNAKDAAQVRYLLPGSSSCAVLVTTRNRTADLAGTRFLDLNVLEDTEALALFSRIVGEDRAAAEPDATAEILVACAGLPLAIRICAARLAARRQWRIATLAGRLRNQHKKLDELKTGDLAVRASFQVSYDALTRAGDRADSARAFRLLSLWQGESISLYAAAALLGVADDDATDALESLVDVNLLESPAPDWYRFHDLLRVYATERAEAEDSAADRHEAVTRILRWYLDTGEAAADAVSPQRYRVPRQPDAGYPPLAFASLEDALNWYHEERANIVSATRQAAAAGLHEVAWRLPPTLSPVFGRWSNWADCVTTHRVGLESARIAGNRAGEAWVLNQLGFALARLREREALERFEQALVIRQELGDTRGQAQTAIGLAEGYLNLLGPGEDALRNMRLAVDLLRPAGAGSMLAVALNNLGEVYFGLGDLRAAEECYIEARDICRQTGSHAEGHALHNLGQIYQLLDRPDEAIANFQEALGKHRESGELFGEAMTLKHLGEAYGQAGDMDKGRASLSAALRIFEQLGDQSATTETVSLIGSLTAGKR